MGISTPIHEKINLNKNYLSFQVIDNTSHPDVDDATKITVKITVAFVRQPLKSVVYS